MSVALDRRLKKVEAAVGRSEAKETYEVLELARDDELKELIGIFRSHGVETVDKLPPAEAERCRTIWLKVQERTC